jgi:hypothetical protein
MIAPWYFSWNSLNDITELQSVYRWGVHDLLPEIEITPASFNLLSGPKN